MVLALAFVPVHLVLDYFLRLRNLVLQSANPEVVNAMTEVLVYFGRNYIGIDEKLQQISPLFPPKLWNNVVLVNSDEPRSNNLVEGWHFRFKKQIPSNHPNVWMFMDAIQREQQYFERYFTRIRTGLGTARKPIYDQLDGRVKQVVSNFSFLSFEDYLKGIADIFKH